MLAFGPGAARASGFNLAWDDCGTAGQKSRVYACSPNTGVHKLVASFVPPPGVNQLAGIEASLQVQSNGATLPSWWQFQGPGACRLGAISVGFDFSGMTSCSDYWAGRAFGGMDYTPSYGGANRGLIRMVCAIPDDQLSAVNSSTEYYAFTLTINHSRSSGPGSCAGCLDAVCITMTDILIAQPAGMGDYTLTSAVNNASVAWQSDACEGAARTGTWGKLKRLYR
jgi:hypothetical protein